MKADAEIQESVLISLSIRDLALVEKAEWTPGAGFNTVTGETGAGKSVLIGAINLALGGRAEKTMIRQGAEAATIEAVFEVKNEHLRKPILDILDQIGIETGDESGQIIIKRIINTSTTGRQWINGSSCTLNALRTVGEMLVDFHGPHDHQSLLAEATQRGLLDAYAQAQPQSDAVASAWQQWRQAEDFYQSLKTDLSNSEIRLDMLKEQALEIERAALQPGEDEEISARLAVASQSSRLAEICRALACEIEENQDSIQSRLQNLNRLLRELTHIDSGDNARQMLAGLETIQATVQDLLQSIRDYAEKIDADPQTLAKLSERYDLIQLLKKKYGPTLQDVMRFHQCAVSEISRFENRDFELAAAKEKLEAAKTTYDLSAKKLGEKRKKAAPLLSSAIKDQLHTLNFPQAEFLVQITDAAPGIHGNEQTEFLFCPNPGEGLRPLKAIASSGEMARVMLAIKTCLATQDQTPLLVFDEVDSNIGGETAVQVGQKLRELGRAHQVLCITHLPQVAAAADTHFVVEKFTDKGRTKTILRKIENSERTKEIVRMLGGSKEAASLAAEMLSQNIKKQSAKRHKPSYNTL